MWISIEKGTYQRLMIIDPDDPDNQIPKPISKMTEANKKEYVAHVSLMNYLLHAIPNDIYNSVDACKDAQKCRNELEEKERESLESVYERLSTLVNVMDHNDVRPIKVSINTKFLNSLQPYTDSSKQKFE
ncbi:hypothetical protein Tco_0042998 [Tanacetum coccineum]